MSDPSIENLPPDEDDSALEEKQERLDRFRGTGVGVEDPNIVGDPGPEDDPPGADPEVEGDEPGLAPGRAPETEPPGA